MENPISVLSPDPVNPAAVRALPGDRPTGRAPARFMRYRMVVLVRDSAEAVSAAGGWLFDRVMAGWEVTVLVADMTNAQPLRILGVTVGDLNDTKALEAAGIPHSVAISGALCESDADVRARVLDWLERGLQEVTLWGEDYAEDLDSRTTSARHVLSRAARAFKARALAASAGSSQAVADAEPFRTGGPLLPRGVQHSPA